MQARLTLNMQTSYQCLPNTRNSGTCHQLQNDINMFQNLSFCTSNVFPNMCSLQCWCAKSPNTQILPLYVESIFIPLGSMHLNLTLILTSYLLCYSCFIFSMSFLSVVYRFFTFWKPSLLFIYSSTFSSSSILPNLVPKAFIFFSYR